jgi:ribonuclease D
VDWLASEFSSARISTRLRTTCSEKVIGVDTEADSFYHYFDKTCLVQIATRRQIYLIDPLGLGGPQELAPLGPVFASKEVCKIFHAAEYDIFVLKRDCAFRFDNLFDSMISAQILGYPSVGLQSIAKRHFGVDLPKDEQRSDWSHRPLSAQQMSYAAADVLYLIQLAERLTRELRKAKRLNWAEEEFEALARRGGRPSSTARPSRIKGSTRRRSRCCARSISCATSARERWIGRRSKCSATAR